MLRQDRDFSIDAGKRQFEERWRREKSVISMGLIWGPNKADDTCGKTAVVGTMERGSTVHVLCSCFTDVSSLPPTTAQ
jgi:hypothetical protein